MNIILVSVGAVIVLISIYFIFSREEKKINDKHAPRGRVEEYHSGGKERRRYERFDAELELKYNVISSPNPGLSTSARNISAGGISILVYEILPKNSFLEMEILVPNSKETVKVKGKIAWCEDTRAAARFDKDGKRTFIAGIEFVDTGKEQQEILTGYINKYLKIKKEDNDGDTKRS